MALKMALPLSFVSIFTSLAFRMDTILSSILKSTVDVGYYTAPYRIM